MATDQEKFSHGFKGKKPETVAEKLAPGPAATKAAKTAPPPSRSGATSPSLNQPAAEIPGETPTGAPYNPSEPGNADADFRKAFAAKKRKERRQSLKKVTRIKQALDFDRHIRAHSFETDRFAEISNEFFQKNPDGSPKTTTTKTPVLKTSPKKVEEEEQRYRKVIHRAKISGAPQRLIKHLNAEAAARVIENNYQIGKNGKLVYEHHVVPVLKHGRTAKEYDREVKDAILKKHQVEEGSKSYFFQSKVSKALERGLQQRWNEEHAEEGFLGQLYHATGANRIVDALSHIEVPTGPHSEIKAETGFRQGGEALLHYAGEPLRDLSKGISEEERTLTHVQVPEGPHEEASFGVPPFEAAAALRKNVIHGLHTGILVGGEYLARPGLAIENTIGKVAGIGGDPLEALLHGRNGQNVISGKDISEKIFGNPQSGFVIDVVTDPTLWVGAGEIHALEGERLASLASRIERVAPDILREPETEAIIKDARERDEFSGATQHLEDVAEQNGIDLSHLGKSKDDKEAIKAWKKEINKRMEARALRDSAHRDPNTFVKDGKETGGDQHFLGGKSRRENVEEAGRREAEHRVEPGVRVKVQTPTGRELTHIDIKLPKKLEDRNIFPTWSHERRDNLLRLRKSRAEAGVLKEFGPDIEDAVKAAKDAKTPEEARAAEDAVKSLKNDLDEALHRAGRNVSESIFKSPAESAAMKSSRRLAHELNRTAAANARSVFHMSVAHNLEDFKGLTEEERFQVGMHMHEYSDTGSRHNMNAIAPLNEKQEKALDALKEHNYELGRYGLDVGSLDALTKDYIFRDVTHGPDPLGGGERTTADEKASIARENASKPDRHRGYAAVSEFTNRDHLATQIEHASGGKLTRTEALKIADDWHDRGKIRAIQEDLAHEVQRSNKVHESDLTREEKAAYEWSLGRQNDTKLFKDLEKTEGFLKLHPDAFKSHDLSESPFGNMTPREANALKRQTATDSLEKLERLRRETDRPELKVAYEKMAMRREAELARLNEERKAFPSPLRERLEKMQDRREKIEAKAASTNFTGERKVFKEAADKLKAKESEMPTEEDDFRDFVPHEASKEYLGSLKDFRESHRDKFAIIDPTVGNYHRSLSEAVKSAYQMRWRAVDKMYGRDTDDALLQSNKDGSIYYHKKTGEEYIHPDSTFAESMPQHRLYPAQLLRDLKSEFWRMGENVSADLFDDFSNGMLKKLSSMTRYTLTTYFPAYHMRNMISDTLNSLLADPGVAFHPVMNFKLGMNSMTAGKLGGTIEVPGFDAPMKGEDYLFMMDTLGLKSQEHMAEFINLAEQGKLADHPWWKTNPFARKGKIGDVAMKYSIRREDIARLQTFLQRMRRNGGDAADAAWHTIKYHFDYADLTMQEKRFARNTFLFYTWYRKNIPLQFLSMIEKPGFFSALTNFQIDLAEGSTPFNVNWNAISPLLPDLSGPVPNSGLIPTYMTNTFASPVVNWNGHATAFSIGLPMADMNLVWNAAESPGTGFRELAGFTVPELRWLIESGTSTNLLTGQKLEGLEPSQWANLFSTAGISLPTDDEGRPILPWQVNVALSNFLAGFGRASNYLTPPSSVEDQGRFSQLFGGGLGSFATGITTYVGPKEGERLAKAYIYKVYERGAQREAVENSGKNEKEVKADLEKFDEQTLTWAKANGIPSKYLHVVPSLGKKMYISKTDREGVTEQQIGGSESGGILSTESGGILGGSSGSSLSPESYTEPSKKYKSETERALDLLKEGSIFGIGSTTKGPTSEDIAKSYADLQKNEMIERLNAPKAADALHRGLEPWREAKVPPTPKPERAKSRTAPHEPTPKPTKAPTEAQAVKILEKNGAPSAVAKAAAKRMGPHGWAEAVRADEAGYGNTPSPKTKLAKRERHKAVAAYHAIKATTENEGLPNFSGFSNPAQEEFAKWFTKYSGLDPEFVGNWVAAEGGGSADGGAGEAGTNNWLGVRYPGSQTHDSQTHFNGTPKQAAKESVEWMYDEGPTPWDEHSAESIQGFKNLKGASAAEQAEYLAGGSRWGTGSITLDNIQYTGNTGVDPANKKKLAESETALKKLGINPASLDNEGSFTVPYAAFDKHVARDLHHVVNSHGYTDDTSKKPITIHGPNGGTVVRNVQGSSGVAAVIDKNQDPEIIARLLLLSAKTGKTIYINSGYRTPSQSESVGGSADDPHTKGEAVDIGVDGSTIESANAISEAEYESVGLYRPYGTAQGGSASEDNHVQLLNGGSPPTAGYVSGSNASAGSTTGSGSTAASGAPVAPGSQLSGPEAQSTPGYHPGQTKRAQIEAARMRYAVAGKISTPKTKSLLSLSDIGKTFEGKKIVERAEAELEKLEADKSPLTAGLKRKPRFRV